MSDAVLVRSYQDARIITIMDDPWQAAKMSPVKNSNQNNIMVTSFYYQILQSSLGITQGSCYRMDSAHRAETTIAEWADPSKDGRINGGEHTHQCGDEMVGFLEHRFYLDCSWQRNDQDDHHIMSFI